MAITPQEVIGRLNLFPVWLKVRSDGVVVALLVEMD